jgi:hypothetical protein
VEVNPDDVERGHWSFGSGDLERGFTPNPSTTPVSLWDVSAEELDANTSFINAVRVTARREDTPIISYFARIFGIESWQMNASAVGYIGFAGSLRRQDVDQPIAICQDALLINGLYSCSVGRMINSGQDTGTNETGGWTSFNQENACAGGTNAREVRNLVCNGGNQESLMLGDPPMATNGGDIQTAFSELYDCWVERTGRTSLWELTLPVVECPSNNVGTCERLVGAVTVSVVWITGPGEDPQFNDAPTQMENIDPDGDPWIGEGLDGEDRWDSFVTEYALQNADGSPAPYAKKSIYFLPDCDVHIPKGKSGGENFGVLARIPVLVE